MINKSWHWQLNSEVTHAQVFRNGHGKAGKRGRRRSIVRSFEQWHRRIRANVAFRHLQRLASARAVHSVSRSAVRYWGTYTRSKLRGMRKFQHLTERFRRVLMLHVLCSFRYYFWQIRCGLRVSMVCAAKRRNETRKIVLAWSDAACRRKSRLLVVGRALTRKRHSMLSLFWGVWTHYTSRIWRVFTKCRRTRRYLSLECTLTSWAQCAASTQVTRQIFSKVVERRIRGVMRMHYSSWHLTSVDWSHFRHCAKQVAHRQQHRVFRRFVHLWNRNKSSYRRLRSLMSVKRQNLLCLAMQHWLLVVKARVSLLRKGRFVCMYVYTYRYIDIYMYTYIYIYIHIYI